MEYSLKISLFSSLDFSSDWKNDFDIQKCYTQIFSSSDLIRVQLSAFETSSVYVSLMNADTKEETPIDLTNIGIQDNYKVYAFELINLAIGSYFVLVKNSYDDEIRFSKFCILDDEQLDDTVLLRYTNRKNRFDAIFLDDEGDNYYFELRVKGGFLFREMSFNTENNDFRDQNYNLKLLEAFPYEKRVLTIGGNEGEPIWMGQKINLIFSASYVTINGFQYVRSDGASVDKEIISDYYPLFIFKIELEPTDFYSSYKDFYPNGYRIHNSPFNDKFN